MTYQTNSDAQTSAWNYLRANAYSRLADRTTETQNRAPAPFTIALSREAGIDADAVARAIGRRLGWQVWNQELLVAIAERLHTRASDLTAVDETHVSWLQESLEAFLEFHSVTQLAYMHQLVNLLLGLGERGECVIVGRGAAQMLPAETTLRVKLIAPLKERIAALSQRLGGGATNRIARKIEQLDRDRARFVKDYFHRDPTDPANFDLVLNLSRLSPDDCADIILDALHAEQASRAERARLRAMDSLAMPA